MNESKGKLTLNAAQAVVVIEGLQNIGGTAVGAVNELCARLGADNVVRSNLLQEMSKAIMREAMAFWCPVCHRTSYNPNDAQNGWCGACQRQAGSPQL